MSGTIWLILLTGAAYRLGRIFLSGTGHDSGTERFIFCTSLGLASLAFLTLGLGFLGLLYTPLFRILVILLNLLIFFNRGDRGAFPGAGGIPLNKLNIFISILLFLAVACNYLRTGIPPLESDVLHYHLTIPKYYLQEHKIYNLTGIIKYSTFPQLMEMLYLLGLLLKGDLLAQKIHFLFGLLSAGAVMEMTRRHIQPGAALLAAALFYFTPMLAKYTPTAMVDIGLTFYIIMAFYAVLKWTGKEGTGWFILFAVFSGAAFGVKYTGGAVVALVPLALLVGGIGGGVLVGEHAGDTALEQRQLGTVIHLDHHLVVSHERDDPSDAAGGDHVVALGQGREHLGPLALALALRADHQEVKDEEHDEDEQQALRERIAWRLAVGRLGRDGRQGRQMHPRRHQHVRHRASSSRYWRANASVNAA